MDAIFAIFLAGIISLMGIGGLELTLSYQHGNALRAATKVASTYLEQGERDYLTQIASTQQHPQNGNPLATGTNVYTSTESQACPSATSAPNQGQNEQISTATRAISGAGGSSCKYYATYTLQTGGSTSSGGSGEISYNVNTNINETRYSGIIVATVRNGPLTDSNTKILATKSRTITVRAFPMAPYVALVNSSDTQDPFIANASGKIGGASSLAEGDTAGTTTGTDTKIYSYASCRYDGGANSNQNSLMQTWCHGQNGSSVQNQQSLGNYNANGASTSGTWAPIDNSQFQNKNWTNGTGAANANN